MWHIETDRTPLGGHKRAGRGTALPLVTMLVSVLAVLCLSGVGLLLGNLNADSDEGAEVRAAYVAELGRADAFASVVGNPSGPWTGRSLTTVLDDRGAIAGEYEYTITDLTLPDENQRCVVLVRAYWPTEANARAASRVQFWMEKDGETWGRTGWQFETDQTGG